MNLFEAMGLVGAGSGLILGATVGFRHGGVAGAIGGGLLGFAAGCAGGYGLVAAGFGSAILAERRSKRRKLRPTLGRFWAKEHLPSWEALKEGLRAGQSLRGRVVLVEYYGLFLDFGRGFPAALTRLDGGFDPGATLPAPGTEVEATILEFDDADREVRLTRRSQCFVCFESVPIGYLIGNPFVRDDGSAYYFKLTTRAHAAFRARLDAGAPVACQVLGDDGLRDVAVEKNGERGELRVRSVTKG